MNKYDVLKHYFGYSEEEIKQRFPTLTAAYLVKENDFTPIVKGWIGSVSIPSTLVVDDVTALKGVCIYINGKLVDEDILKSVKKDWKKSKKGVDKHKKLC